ncbi:MAG: tetratricopeptide repeat protein [Spirochaetes bacterium]|nr:tetratricopeptide repeat protein [Spirochaetota bacterium]MBU1082199.1 tetratricopeptide repeat protein [Spirochaetota bacterium]
MKLKRVATFAAVVVLGASLASAQTAGASAAPATKPADDLRHGIELFANARYSEALPIFDSLFLDSSAGALRADGAYWSAMTLLASGDPSSAEKAVESFLVAFPGHARTSEMMYQKARAVFLQKDYERSVRAFQAFIAAFPESDQVPASVFWSAESLYSLGRLSDAEKLYRTIGERYPDSVKAEAAKYRLSLIQFKYREDELLTLLKWSHEESLRIIEEFQRREKAYEQALDVYQKRYGEAKRGVAQTQSTLEEQVASLKAAMDDLAKRLQEKDARVVELERLQAELGASAAAPKDREAAAASAAPETGEAELLAMKQRTLALMQFYLERLAARSTSGGGK